MGTVGDRWGGSIDVPFMDHGEQKFVQPDATVWFNTRKPTKDQWLHSLSNNLPHPDIWVEVAWNKDPDRKVTLQNLIFEY